MPPPHWVCGQGSDPREPPHVSGSGPDHWFEPLADHLGSAYLRYSFTKGTANEVAFLDRRARARAGQAGARRRLRAGTPRPRLGRAGHRGARGRHLASGSSSSPPRRPPPGATLRAPRRPRAALRRRVRRRHLAVPGRLRPGRRRTRGRSADRRSTPTAWSWPAWPERCGPGGRVAVSAFSSYFQVRFLEDADTFDADRGVNHERTTSRTSTGADADADLWTTCFTPAGAAAAGPRRRPRASSTSGR